MVRTPKLQKDPGFADASLADQRDYLPVSGLRLSCRSAEALNLVLSSNELRQAACGECVYSRSGFDALKLIYLHLARDASEADRSDRRYPNESLNQSKSVARQQDGSWRRKQLQSLCNVCRNAVHAKFDEISLLIVHRDHNRTRIDSDSDLQEHSEVPSNFSCVGAHRFLYVKGGIAGSYRVVFVSKRRAKARHDSVAFRASNSLVTVDDLHHYLDGRF